VSTAIAPAPRAITTAVYTVRELSILLGLSQRTIWRLADGGMIPGKLRIGASVRFLRSVVDQWVEKGCPRPKNR
jgi:excisionase family DNA binding protein